VGGKILAADGQYQGILSVKITMKHTVYSGPSSGQIMLGEGDNFFFLSPPKGDSTRNLQLQSQE
jgi:hypothetical protein